MTGLTTGVCLKNIETSEISSIDHLSGGSLFLPGIAEHVMKVDNSLLVEFHAKRMCCSRSEHSAGSRRGDKQQCGVEAFAKECIPGTVQLYGGTSPAHSSYSPMLKHSVSLMFRFN